MRIKIVLAVCLALACAVLVVTMRPSATSASDPRVEKLHEHLVLLDGYLEHYANDRYNHYPTVAQVRKGGIPAPLWPANPWTGRPMAPGTGNGAFKYAVSATRLSCTLTAHYPGGTLRIHSSVPRTRKTQNDHRTIEGAELIQYFADQWARHHGGQAPTAEQMASDAAVGKQSGVSWWPHDPWTHQKMHQGTGWADFTYRVDADSGIFSIIVHFSRGGTRTLRGPFSKTLAAGVARPGDGRALSFVDKQVQMNILLLQGYLNTQAEKKGFVYPARSAVKKGGALVAPVWPVNPWTGGTMAPGASKGTYTYTVAADLSGYTLVGHLSKGSYKVAGGVPRWLKNERDASTKAGLALVQQYVEMWARAHAGAYPAVAGVASGGPVGLQPGVPISPQSPWTHAAMAQGQAKGDFAYSLTGAGSSYTLHAHLATGKDWVLSSSSD